MESRQEIIRAQPRNCAGFLEGAQSAGWLQAPLCSSCEKAGYGCLSLTKTFLILSKVFHLPSHSPVLP